MVENKSRTIIRYTLVQGKLRALWLKQEVGFCCSFEVYLVKSVFIFFFLSHFILILIFCLLSLTSPTPTPICKTDIFIIFALLTPNLISLVTT